MKIRITLAVCLLATFAGTLLWSQSPQGSAQTTSNLRSTMLGHLLRLPSPGSVAAGSAFAKKLSLRTAAVHLYSFASADFPGAASSQATGVNAGTTVGIFVFDPKSATEHTKSFTFNGGTYRIFNMPGAVFTGVLSINGNGQIAGEYSDSASVIHGFVDTAGTFTTIDYPAATATGTAVTDVSLNGEIVGAWQDATATHGFTDVGGTFTSIDFPGATFTQVAGVNSAGEVVGIYDDATNVEHGFTYVGGVYSQLDPPLSTSTVAFGINDSNVISGSYTDGSSVTHGFLYAKGVFNTIDVPGAASTQFTHINNTNKFAGYYIDQSAEIHGLTGH
jgi:hypothetical protein